MNAANKLRSLVTISPFFFPVYLLRFTVFQIPFTALELFIYLLFGLWVLSLFRPKVFYFKRPLPWYFLAAGLLMVGATIGVLKAPDFLSTAADGNFLSASRTALGIWKGWVVAPSLYFIVLSQSLCHPDHVKKFLRCFVISAVLVSLTAYGMVFFGHGITADLRLTGFYESANYLALYLVPAILLNVVWILQGAAGNRGQSLLDIATLTILLHALFFTQSYAGILAVFGSLILYALYVMLRRPGNLKKAFFGMLVLLAALSFIAFSQLNTPKFQQFLDVSNRSSTTVRFQIYRVTARLIADHWLWGVGPGLYQARYQNAAPEVLGRPPMEWNIPHPHNIFFAFWLNAGLLGLLGLIGFVLLAHRQFTYPLLAFWGIILHGFFDTPFWKNDLAMIFWAVVGAIALLQSYGTHSAQKPKAQTRVRSRRVSARSAPA